MASRIAVRYIPRRFSSNSRNLFDRQGKAIDQSFSSVNQTTAVKPPTTTNHQWRPKSNPICREEFNHLQKRVNRVEERTHGIQKNLIRGVEKSGSTEIVAIKGVEQKLKELEKTVNDFKSREELAYQEKVKEIGRSNEIKRGVEDRVKAVEKTVNEALTTHADFTCRQIEASDLQNQKFDEKVREVIKILKEGEKNIAIQVLTNQKDLILERQKFEEKRKQVEKTLEELAAGVTLRLKGFVEGAKEFEKKLKEGEKIAIQVFKDRQDSQYQRLKFEERVKEVEKLREEGAKEFEKKLKECEQIASQVLKDHQDLAYKRLKFEERVKEVEKHREEVWKLLKVSETFVNQVLKSREDLTYREKEANDLERMNFVRFQESIKKVEERMDKFEEKGAAMYRNPCVYMMYGAGVYAAALLLDRII